MFTYFLTIPVYSTEIPSRFDKSLRNIDNGSVEKIDNGSVENGGNGLVGNTDNGLVEKTDHGLVGKVVIFPTWFNILLSFIYACFVHDFFVLCSPLVRVALTYPTPFRFINNPLFLFIIV